MKRNYSLLYERVISSRVPTDMVFDEITTEKIHNILMTKAHQIIGRRPEELLQKSEEEQERLVKRFAISIVKPLHDIPHFLYNRIDFESHPVGSHQSLFGTGYQHTFWTIITIIINESMSPNILVEAIGGNFNREVLRLRSVVRHEFAHRLDMERIHADPIKRIQSMRFKKRVSAPLGYSEYHGKPTEILAHANHTVELMSRNMDKEWREVLANFVLSDISPYLLNTRKYISLVVKLTKEYNIPFTKRLLLKRYLISLALQMHVKLKDLLDKSPLEQRNTIIRVGVSPEEQKQYASVRLQA